MHTPICQWRHRHMGSTCKCMTLLLLRMVRARLSSKDSGSSPPNQKSHFETGIGPKAIAQPSMMTSPTFSPKPGNNQVSTTDVVKPPKAQTCGKTLSPPPMSPLRPSPGRLSELPTVSSSPSSKTTSTICQIPTLDHRHVHPHSTTESAMYPPNGHDTDAGCHEKTPERYQPSSATSRAPTDN